MLQNGSYLYFCDNSGLKWLRCIQTYGLTHNFVGHYVIGSVQKINLRSKKRKKYFRGQLRRVLVIGSSQWTLRSSGIRSQSGRFLCCVFNERGSLMATRFYTRINYSLRFFGYGRLLSISYGYGFY